MAKEPKRIRPISNIISQPRRGQRTAVNGNIQKKTPNQIAKDIGAFAKEVRDPAITRKEQLDKQNYDRGYSPDQGDDLGNDGPENYVDDEEDVARKIQEELDEFIDEIMPIRRFYLHRSYQDQAKEEHANWKIKLPTLAKAYVLYKQKGVIEVEEGIDISKAPVSIFTISLTAQRMTTFRPGEGEDLFSFMVQRGFFPASPSTPKFAFSIDLLELFNASQAVANADAYGMVQVFCSLAKVPFSESQYKRFSKSARILRNAIRYNKKKLRLLIRREKFGKYNPIESVCVPCQYTDEVVLVPDVLVAVDGGFSFKRVKIKNELKLPLEDSDFFEDPEIVDKFEVGKQKTKEKEIAKNITCTSNWKAADQSNNSSAPAALDETGAFSLNCRHGTCVSICDIIQSVEKYKYPFSLLARAVSGFCPSDGEMVCGYDIACRCQGSLTSHWEGFESDRISSLPEDAGEEEKKRRPLNILLTCGVWHGYAHNRACQLQFHPRVNVAGIEGVGLEDFEVVERFWSWLNKCAYSTRRATKLNRRERLETSIYTWNDSKSTNIGNWLCGRFNLTTDTTKELEAAVKIILVTREITFDQLVARTDKLLEAEGEYFRKKSTKEEQKVQETLGWEAHYVNSLSKIEEMHTRMNEIAKTPFKFTLFKQSLDAELKTSHSHAKKLNLAEPWTVTSPAFLAAQQRVRLQQFKLAHEALQKVVLRKEAEMSKANLPRTNARLRAKITNGIHNRSTEIKEALLVRNQRAVEVGIEAIVTISDGVTMDYHLTLEYEPISADQDWRTEKIREEIRVVQHLRRAREEMIRLRVETDFTFHEAAYWVKLLEKFAWQDEDLMEESEDGTVREGDDSVFLYHYALVAQEKDRVDLKLKIIRSDLQKCMRYHIVKKIGARKPGARGWEGNGSIPLRKDGSIEREDAEDEHMDRNLAEGADENTSDGEEGSDQEGLDNEMADHPDEMDRELWRDQLQVL